MIGRWLKATLAVMAALLLLVLLILWRGIDIDHLALGPVEATQVRLVLEGKLELSVERLAITPGQDDRDAPPKADDLTLARSLLNAVRWTERLFSRIEIAHLDIGGLVGDFRFQRDGTGFLNLAAEGAAFLRLESGGFTLSITFTFFDEV